MRKDMHKVLTERVRAGGGKHKDQFGKDNTPKEKRFVPGVKGNVKVDLSVKKESMRKRHIMNYGGKQLTDHLHPMERFLVSRCGKPWDKVWSEICKVLKGNGMQANHVKEHVKNYVGGVTHGGQKDSMWKSYRDKPEYMYTLVYVDENGILRENKKYRMRFWKKHPEKVYSHVVEDHTNFICEYHKINGCWYRITVIPDPMAFNILDLKLKKEAINKKNAKKLDLENRLSTTRSKIFPEKK